MKNLLFIFLCVISLKVNAQLIHGVVCDKNDAPVPFATISLLNKVDSSFVEGELSDKDGLFSINHKDVTNCLLSVSSIGYKTSYTAKISDGMHISLEEQTTELQGVVIKGQMPKLHLVPGGTRTLISGSFLADAGSATDILSQLPRVKVSDEGISVLGKGQSAIYIDNREITDPAELERLSSQKVKSIEVLTTPGAKYAADKKSVIVIKTLDDNNNGFGLDFISSNKRATKFSTKNDLNLYYHKSNINVYDNIQVKNQATDISQDVRNNILGKDNIELHTIDLKHANRFWGIVNKMGFDLDLSKKHHIGGFYELQRDFPTRYYIWNREESICVNGKSNSYDAIYQDGTNKGGPNSHLNLYYSGLVGKMKIDANSMLYWTKKYTEKIQTEQMATETKVIPTSNTSNGRIIANKITLSYPLLKNLNAEVGTEITSTRSKQKYNSQSNLIESSMADVSEKRVAGFLNAIFKTADFTFGGGVRYEHLSNTTIGNSTEDDLSYNNNNWFPNVQLGYSHGDFEMSLGYSSKISRPTYSQLSNNVTYDTRYIYEGGNPYLKSTIEHILDASISYSWLNLSIEYEHDSNPIYNWFEWYDYDRNIIKLTSANISGIDLVSASLTGEPVVGVWHPIIELDLNKQFLDASKYSVNENFKTLGFVGLFNNQFVLKTWQFGVSYCYTSSMADGFIKSKSTNLLDMYVKKKLLKNNLQVQLKFNDILDDNHNRCTLYSPINIMSQDRSYKTRSVQLSVIFNLHPHNKLKHQVMTDAGADEKERL